MTYKGILTAGALLWAYVAIWVVVHAAIGEWFAVTTIGISAISGTAVIAVRERRRRTSKAI